MLRWLLIVFVVVAATFTASPRISRADCGPGNDNNGTGTLDNTITNADTCANGIFGGNNNSTGTQTNTINNNGTVDGNSAAFTGGIQGGTNTATGTQTNTINNSGSVTGRFTGGSNQSTGTQNVTVNNTGQINDVFVGGANSGGGTQNVTVTSSNQALFLQGGTNYNGGQQTVQITNTGTTGGIIGGTLEGGTQIITVTNSGTVNGNLIGGITYNCLCDSGTQTNSIILEKGSVVTGDVAAGYDNGSPTVSQTNTIILKADVVVNGTIYGDGNTVPTSNSTLIFNQTISDKAEYDHLKDEIAHLLPSSGQITINGQLYKYADFNQLIDLLVFTGVLNIRVTWFAPDDGRIDPRPGDHLAAYCDYKNKTISAILIGTDDSQGKMLATFSDSVVLSAGKSGLSASLGTLGVISLSGDAQGNFWLAWNGGIYGATGQGDFAKGFNCNFNS